MALQRGLHGVYLTYTPPRVVALPARPHHHCSSLQVLASLSFFTLPFFLGQPIVSFSYFQAVIIIFLGAGSRLVRFNKNRDVAKRRRQPTSASRYPIIFHIHFDTARNLAISSLTKTGPSFLPLTSILYSRLNWPFSTTELRHSRFTFAKYFSPSLFKATIFYPSTIAGELIAIDERLPGRESH